MRPLPDAHWFTASRLQRLALTLSSLPSSQQDIPITESMRRLWRACGGPYDELAALLHVLMVLGLVLEVGTVTRRTVAGDRVAKAIGRNDLTPLGATLVRAGVFHGQSRFLIENGSSDGEGNLGCPLRVARIGASQLLGVLTWWRDVRLLPQVFIPKSLAIELNAVWALLPPPIEVPKWARERKAVGDRAEIYTLQTERSRVQNPSAIRWVARDADDIGWDVEDRSNAPIRRIEVKGRRDEVVIFFLSENEWNKAREFGPEYEIHFWGEIDLQREPAVEYAVLRAAGYPLVISDLASEMRDGRWIAEPVRWRVRRAPPANRPVVERD
jgi:hypothetical protein